MKLRVLFAIISVLFVSSINSSLLAQSGDSETKTGIKSPDKSFYFYFINGYALAYKFQYSENSDLRLHLDFSSSYSDTKRNNDNENNFITSTNKQSNEDKTTSSYNSITLDFAYLYNFYRSPLGQAYVGFGPFASYGRNKQETSSNGSYTQSPPPAYQSSDNRIDKDLSYGFSAGLSTFIGLEAFLSNNLKVFAETQLSGGRNWSKSESDTNAESTNSSISSKSINSSSGTSGTWYYNLTSVRIGIGISI